MKWENPWPVRSRPIRVPIRPSRRVPSSASRMPSFSGKSTCRPSWELREEILKLRNGTNPFLVREKESRLWALETKRTGTFFIGEGNDPRERGTCNSWPKKSEWTFMIKRGVSPAGMINRTRRPFAFRADRQKAASRVEGLVDPQKGRASEVGPVKIGLFPSQRARSSLIRK